VGGRVPAARRVGSNGQYRGIRPRLRAQRGIAAVAESLPQNPGEDAVRAVRAAVWGAPDDALGGLPLGVAFAAFTLGFIVGEENALVRTSGSWTRVSLRRGHVIVRGPARTGMTAVRETGQTPET